MNRRDFIRNMAIAAAGISAAGILGGAAEAVFIGPDDVAAGKARVKDLATHEEREICL